MKTPKNTDLYAALHKSRSGLRDAHRRSLMRNLFLVTGVALAVFGSLQVMNEMIVLATGEYVASALLFFGYCRIRTTPHLHWWIYGYLVSGFAFALAIMAVPEASVTSFVWVLMIPVLSYLLLGKRDGLRLSVPFLMGGCITYGLYLGSVSDVRSVIDLFNMALCAGLMLSFIHVYEGLREDAEKNLALVAQHDSLTGLANRASFQSLLERTVAECGRSGSGFALVIMDIDHFKVVNDTMGHDAGDHALTRIGGLLTERLRTTDSVGRLGGEEFGLILRDVKPEDSYQLMDDLRQRIADTTIPYGEATIRLTASFGIAHFPEHGKTAEILYRVADQCLYSGKRDGRNVVASADISVKQQGSFSY